MEISLQSAEQKPLTILQFLQSSNKNKSGQIDEAGQAIKQVGSQKVEEDHQRAFKNIRNLSTERVSVYPNGQNREFEKEAAQIFASGASGLPGVLKDASSLGWGQRQGASEDQKFAAKLTQSKTDSSDYFGIVAKREEKKQTVNDSIWSKIFWIALAVAGFTAYIRIR